MAVTSGGRLTLMSESGFSIRVVSGIRNCFATGCSFFTSPFWKHLDVSKREFKKFPFYTRKGAIDTSFLMFVLYAGQIRLGLG